MMSNDPSTPDRDLIDELASRLLDGDLALSDVETAWREVVMARRDEFARHRDALVAATPLVATPLVASPLVALPMAPIVRGRRLVYFAAGLAAAALIGLVAVGLNHDSADHDSDVALEAATAMTPASEAPVAASMAPAAEPAYSSMAADASSGAGVGNLAKSMVSACVDPAGRPALFVGTYEGDAVEVHFSLSDGLVVYRLDNCQVLLGIVP